MPTSSRPTDAAITAALTRLRQARAATHRSPNSDTVAAENDAELALDQLLDKRSTTV